MTGCDTHGELLGGYVLGALSADETEAMRRHLDSCSACSREHAALAGLPALLDEIEPADVPPPLPPPALEEAVLDGWARARRRARSRDAAAPRRAGTVAPSPRQAAAAVLGALAAAALGLALLLPTGDRAYATGMLAGASAAAGSFSVERVATGTRVRLEASRLPADAYEVWCLRTDGRWVNGGSFRPDAAGRAAVTLTAAVDPGDYHTVVVTRAGRGGGDRGPEVLRGDLVY